MALLPGGPARDWPSLQTWRGSSQNKPETRALVSVQRQAFFQRRFCSALPLPAQPGGAGENGRHGREATCEDGLGPGLLGPAAPRGAG